MMIKQRDNNKIKTATKCVENKLRYIREETQSENKKKSKEREENHHISNLQYIIFEHTIYAIPFLYIMLYY